MEITKLPNKILTRKAKPVSLEVLKSGAFKDLIFKMKEIMKENKGVGLSANQINKDASIFVIDENLAREHNVPEVYINPEITEYSRREEEMEEGCLSIPEYFTQIQRAKKIKIKALDENGNKIKLKARGFLARVLQHETDHLNGVILKDRLNK